MKRIVIIATVFALTCIYVYATCYHTCNSCGCAYRNSDTTCPASGGHYAKCKHEAGQQLWCQTCHDSEHGLKPHEFVSAPADCHSYVEEEEGND